MKTRYLAAAILAMGGLLAGPASGMSLTEAMVLAYSNNPTLQAQRASLRATDETISSALSTYRPTVQITGSASETDSSSNRLTSPNGRTSPRSATFSVTQPLYRGGRTVAGVQQADANIRAGRATLRNTEQTVLLNTVRGYMDVLRDQAIVDLNRNNEERLRRQLQATLDRFEVGEVTRTDVAQAQARLSRARSDRIAAEGALQASRAVFLSAVGAPATELSRVPTLEGVPDTEEEAIAIALTESPLIEQAGFAEVAAQRSVRAAEGALYPTLSLNGSATHSEQAQVQNSETDSATIGASVTIPLYQQGSEYATIRQQKQTANQRRIEIELQRRSVRESVTRSWASLSSASDRIRSGVDQVRAAEIALDGVRQEAEVGSRTTLDVLDSEQELLDARVSLVRSERDEYVAGFELKSAIGRLSAFDLNLPVDRYDPTINYNYARGKIIGKGLQGE
jgi:outer membrane protein